MQLYVTIGGQWATSQNAVQQLARDEGKPGEWRPVDVPTKQAGLLSFLNEHRVGAPPMRAEPKSVLRPMPGDLQISHVTPPPVQPSDERARQVERDILIEEAIAEADYPRALRLAEHVHCRLMEHGRAAGRAK